MEENSSIFFLLLYNTYVMPLTDTYASTVWSSSKGATSNAVPQTVIADPGVGQLSYVCDENSFSIINLDTVDVTFTLKITGGTSRIVEKITLSPNDKFVNGNKYVVAAGETLTVELAATVATTQPTWSASYFQIIN